MIRDNNVQYLCAKIGGHWVGIDVKNVLEIASPGEKGLSQFSEIGNSYTYNGKEIKAINLSELLLGDSVRYEQANRVLISQLASEKVGFIVDSAEEIIRTTKDHLKPAQDLSDSAIKDSMLDGCLDLDDRVINVISIANIYDKVSSLAE